jgi:hypothetical protein
MFDGYRKTATKVELRGVYIGPSSEFSCGPFDFEAIVTHDAGGLTMFRRDAEEPCVSPTGQSLVVNGLSGSVVAVAGDTTVKFNAFLRDAGADGGTGDLFLMCQVELHASVR